MTEVRKELGLDQDGSNPSIHELARVGLILLGAALVGILELIPGILLLSWIWSRLAG